MPIESVEQKVNADDFCRRYEPTFFEFDAVCSVDRRYANRYRDAFSAGAVPKRPELRRAVRWTINSAI